MAGASPAITKGEKLKLPLRALGATLLDASEMAAVLEEMAPEEFMVEQDYRRPLALRSQTPTSRRGPSTKERLAAAVPCSVGEGAIDWSLLSHVASTESMKTFSPTKRDKPQLIDLNSGGRVFFVLFSPRRIGQPENVVVIKFAASRLLMQAEQFANELTRHVDIVAPDCRIVRQVGGTSCEWKELVQANAKLGAVGEEMASELDALPCLLLMEYVPGAVLMETDAAFEEPATRLQTFQDLGRLFLVDMVLGNADRLPCTELCWRGNPGNIMFGVHGSKYGGRLVAIDSCVQRRPPVGKVNAEDAAVDRLSQLVLNDKKVAEKLLKESLVSGSAKALAALEADATGAQCVAAFVQGMRACLDRVVTIKGLLEMMHEKAMEGVTSFIVDIKAHHAGVLPSPMPPRRPTHSAGPAYKVHELRHPRRSVPSGSYAPALTTQTGNGQSNRTSAPGNFQSPFATAAPSPQSQPADLSPCKPSPTAAAAAAALPIGSTPPLSAGFCTAGQGGGLRSSRTSSTSCSTVGGGGAMTPTLPPVGRISSSSGSSGAASAGKCTSSSSGCSVVTPPRIRSAAPQALPHLSSGSACRSPITATPSGAHSPRVPSNNKVNQGPGNAAASPTRASANGNDSCTSSPVRNSAMSIAPLGRKLSAGGRSSGSSNSSPVRGPANGKSAPTVNGKAINGQVGAPPAAHTPPTKPISAPYTLGSPSKASPMRGQSGSSGKPGSGILKSGNSSNTPGTPTASPVRNVAPDGSRPTAVRVRVSSPRRESGSAHARSRPPAMPSRTPLSVPATSPANDATPQPPPSPAEGAAAAAAAVAAAIQAVELATPVPPAALGADAFTPPPLLRVLRSDLSLTLALKSINKEAQKDDQLSMRVEAWKNSFRERSEHLRAAVDEWQAKHNVVQVLSTGFLDGTHPIVDTYELKIRLDHMLRRLRVLQENAFATPPSKIMDKLFIGGAVSADSLHILRHLDIHHIVNATEELLLPPDGSGMIALRVPLRDVDEEDVSAHWDAVTQFVHDAMAEGNGVLIHCFEGKSRSVTLTLAFLMKEYEYSLKKALELVKAGRPEANPNPGFMAKLIQLDKQLFGVSSVDASKVLKKGKPEAVHCRICGAATGLSTASLGVHMKRYHPEGLSGCDPRNNM